MVGIEETPEEEKETGAEADATNDAVDEELVGELATLKDWLDLDVDNIIGIFGKPDEMRAMLRRASGEILTIKAGDEALGGSVQAIGEDRVVIVKNARSVVLKIGRGPRGSHKTHSR